MVAILHKRHPAVPSRRVYAILAGRDSVSSKHRGVLSRGAPHLTIVAVVSVSSARSLVIPHLVWRSVAWTVETLNETVDAEDSVTMKRLEKQRAAVAPAI